MVTLSPLVLESLSARFDRPQILLDLAHLISIRRHRPKDNAFRKFSVHGVKEVGSPAAPSTDALFVSTVVNTFTPLEE